MAKGAVDVNALSVGIREPEIASSSDGMLFCTFTTTRGGLRFAGRALRSFPNLRHDLLRKY